VLLIYIEFSRDVVLDELSKSHSLNRCTLSCSVDVDPKRLGSLLSGCFGAVLENGSNHAIVFLPRTFSMGRAQTRIGLKI
jgi:hypothetical protein